MLTFAGILPIQGTEIATSWDHFYYVLIAISAVFFFGVIGAMIYFGFRYCGKCHPQAEHPGENHLLIEVLWTAIPTVIVMGIFVWGYIVYKKMAEPPVDAYEIRVIGKQWLWQFQYDDGRTTVGELFVPVNKPVKLLMTSDDVIHSFFIPDFRVKKDVVPGMYTHVWFETSVPGPHQVFCAEYCGTAHSGMLAKIYALEPSDWELWKRGKKIKIPGKEEIKGPSDTVDAASAGSLVQQGMKLTQAKGCVACHSTDGSVGVGPSYKGLFGSEVEIQNGQKVVADENYIRESIENPQAKIVKGFNPVMPPFKGLLTEEEMNAIIAYIRSLK